MYYFIMKKNYRYKIIPVSFRKGCHFFDDNPYPTAICGSRIEAKDKVRELELTEF